MEMSAHLSPPSALPQIVDLHDTYPVVTEFTLTVSATTTATYSLFKHPLDQGGGSRAWCVPRGYRFFWLLASPTVMAAAVHQYRRGKAGQVAYSATNEHQQSLAPFGLSQGRV
mmetsp:Transcript_98336/g.169467  ORF Transcript_98336/g.169467 Transcript_98336/m.169467 type:complete len:113 (+) Transcript_98336:1050-1388(+)